MKLLKYLWYRIIKKSMVMEIKYADGTKRLKNLYRIDITDKEIVCWGMGINGSYFDWSWEFVDDNVVDYIKVNGAIVYKHGDLLK